MRAQLRGDPLDLRAMHRRDDVGSVELAEDLLAQGAALPHDHAPHRHADRTGADQDSCSYEAFAVHLGITSKRCARLT